MDAASIPLLVVIPARDEAGVLPETLRRIRATLREGDSLAVIDDGSTDGTPEVAERCGARVMRRGEGDSGKGLALRWFVESAGESLDRWAGVVIFDADSLVAADCLDVLRDRLRQGVRAAQAFVQPVSENPSAVAALAAYSELLEQMVDDRLRAALGWPVRLRGTGMAFAPDVLRAVAPHLRTFVEDVELSLLLAARGVMVIRVPEAVVFDPKPGDARLASQQRSRWLRGQWDAWRLYRGEIVRLAGRGPWAWSLIGSVLIKPKSLMLLAKIAGLAAVLAVTRALPAMAVVAFVLGLSLLLDVAYYSLGLAMKDGRALLLRGIASTPAYVLMWIRSAVAAPRAAGAWLRSRESPR